MLTFSVVLFFSDFTASDCQACEEADTYENIMDHYCQSDFGKLDWLRHRTALPITLSLDCISCPDEAAPLASQQSQRQKGQDAQDDVEPARRVAPHQAAQPRHGTRRRLLH